MEKLQSEKGESNVLEEIWTGNGSISYSMSSKMELISSMFLFLWWLQFHMGYQVSPEQSVHHKAFPLPASRPEYRKGYGERCQWQALE